jgi:hypothetical protein
MSKDEFDIDEIKVVAGCISLVDKPDNGISISFGSDGWEIGRGEGTDRSADVLWATRVTVSNALHFSAGNKQEFPFTIQLPDSYKPAKGTIRKAKWSLRGIAVVNKRLNVSSKEIQFNVADPYQTR